MIKQLLKLKYHIVPLVIFWALLSVSIYFNTQHEINTYLDNKTDSAQIEYNAVYKKLKEQAEMIFLEDINTPSVINIFKGTYNADKDLQAFAREKLYNHLLESYQGLHKLVHLDQLQFIFPDNKSFLRFHKPANFGDDLTTIRETVAYVNKYKKAIDGFEEGRTYNAFRFVYPLFDEDDNYLGDVEVSFSLKSFEDILDNKLHTSQFIILKSVINSKTYKGESKPIYKDVPISDKFLFDIRSMNKTKKKSLMRIGENITDRLKEDFEKNILSEKSFSLTLALKNTTTTLTFLPVKNPVTNKTIAYSVLLAEDSVLNEINNKFIILQLLNFILFMIIFYFIHRNNKHQDELLVSESKYRTIIENTKSNYFVYTHNTDGVFTYLSDSITGVLGYKVDEFMTDVEKYLTKHPINKDASEYTRLSISGIQQAPYLIEIYHADGTKKWLEVTETPILDKGGNVISVDGIAKDITKEIRINNLIGNSQTILFYWKAEDCWPVEHVSQNITQFGYSVDDFISGKVAFSDIIHPDDLKRVSREVKAYTQNHVDKYIQVYRIVTADGETKWIDDRTVIERNSDNEPIYYLGTIVDITKQKLSEIEITKQNKLLQDIIDGVGDGITVINKDYTISMMNSKAKELLNDEFIEDINNPKCYEISHHRASPCDGINHPCPLVKTFETCESNSVIHTHTRKDGSDMAVEVTTSPLVNNDEEVYAVVESVHDISALLSTQKSLKLQTEILQHRAEYDELTDLPNRTLFLDRLSQSIKFAKYSDKKVGVLFIDLDHFKEINDSIGHHAGDEVLKIVSNRLLSQIRETDTLARLGGDEFTIVLSSVDDTDIVIETIEKLMNVMREAIYIDNQSLYTTLSIGITMYPEDADTAVSLLKNADAAMYKAKNDGRNTYSFYNQSMTEKALERIVMESSMRIALENNDFLVYYQPQVNAKKNKLIGMEALVRWQHDSMGLISPAKFIPLAEEIGLIVELDRFVMRIAMTQMSKWYKEGLNPGVLAMNLAVKQLQETDFIDMFQKLMQETGCKPEWIELEVTEGQVMKNPENSILVLNAINDMGIKTAVDDFGTGYSSLAYLKRLPIDKLKIDQAFVRDLPDDEEDVAITRAVIALANSLSLRVIAEGVETKEQKEFLVENGCSNIQGYYYSKPIPADEMEVILRNNKIG